MSTATTQYSDLVKQSQEAVLAAVDTWTKAVQEAFAELPKTPTQVDASGVVDQLFDFTEKVLEVQRDFAKKVITESAAAAESASATVVKAANEVKAATENKPAAQK
jgi:hypothetical protein